jgi:ubiquinone/menaquinone biosynthesis C-methylase UbiE
MNYKRITIESYDQNAKILSERFKSLMELKRRSEFQRFLDLLKGNKVLDLGCGAGDHSLFFKEKGLEAVSVDLSEEMVKLCREKGLDAQIQDIEDLDFENNSFDGIWAVTSLLHVPKSNLKKVVEDLSRMLKEKGILYVCVKKGDGEGLVEDKFGTRFFAFWKEDELKKIFEDSFDFLESTSVTIKETVFLQMFFKKKS